MLQYLQFAGVHSMWFSQKNYKQVKCLQKKPIGVTTKKKKTNLERNNLPNCIVEAKAFEICSYAEVCK